MNQMNGARGLSELESAGPTEEECFHCTDNPSKFLPLPRDQQPYCSKCFNALFVFDVKNEDNNNNKDAVVKSKPPPVPPKPKGKPPLYSTLPQPFMKPLVRDEVPEIVVALPPSPPPPSPPKSISPDLGIESDEAPLPPPPPASYPPDVTSKLENRRAFSPISGNQSQRQSEEVTRKPFEDIRRAYSPVQTSPQPSEASRQMDNIRRAYSPVQTSSQSPEVSRKQFENIRRAYSPVQSSPQPPEVKQFDGVRRAYSPLPARSQSPDVNSKQLENLRTAYSPIPPSVIGSSPSGSTASSPNLSFRAGNSGVIGRGRVGNIGIDYRTLVAAPGGNSSFKPVEPADSKPPGKVSFGNNVETGRSAPNRQISENEEESHLDQLNMIFKMSGMTGNKARPSENQNVTDSGGSSVGKPSIASKPKFMCSNCGGNLLGKTVETKDGKMFCTPCYRVAISNRNCVRCGGEFNEENEHVSYKGQDWHVTCFSCEKCKLPIGKKTFCYQKDGIFCSDCYFETSGRMCVKCKKYLKSTGFLFRNEPWHHDCFVCTLCQQSLGDKEIFCKDDQPYCINCYDQQYVEKCAKCSKILVGETVEYESKQYHDNCFCCDQCNNPIGSNSFFPREGKIYCESCYTEKFGKRCKSCQQIISPSSGFGLVFKEEHYHRDCFVCTTCRKSLEKIPVHSSKSDGNNPYCGECYDDQYSKRCTACLNVISGVIGSKFMSFQGRYWHVECFNCKICQTSLENRKFAPVQGEMHCIACSRFGHST